MPYVPHACKVVERTGFGVLFLGNVWNFPQRAQTGGYSSSLLLQLLFQEGAMEPGVR